MQFQYQSFVTLLLIFINSIINILLCNSQEKYLSNLVDIRYVLWYNIITTKKKGRFNKMNKNITIEREKLQGLIGFIHDILDFVDTESMEDNENKDIVINGYENFVKPVEDALNQET